MCGGLFPLMAVLWNALQCIYIYNMYCMYIYIYRDVEMYMVMLDVHHQQLYLCLGRLGKKGRPQAWGRSSREFPEGQFGVCAGVVF